MTSRRLLPAAAREALFGIPSDIGSLERNYVLAEDDLELIATRKSAANRLGLAAHIALLRHPGQGWLDGDALPEALVAWLAEQVAVPSSSLSGYGLRGATRSSHRRLAIRHLHLHAFVPNLHIETAIGLAARAAFDTDDGRRIMARLTHDMKVSQFVLPPVATLERIGIAGRARARRMAAQAINDGLGETLRATMGDLLRNDSELGQSRLAWLRRWPQSKSVGGLDGILDRLEFVRAVSLPSELGQDIHPARLSRFAREGRVAAIDLIEDFGERRRIATVAAQVWELETVLTDAAIAVFEVLTGKLFSRSKSRQEQSWSASKAPVGRLIAMFGGTIDALVDARAQQQDVFEILDAAVGWERLVNVRGDIASYGKLATEDSLLVAARNYRQLRRFAPRFFETFDFSFPKAGEDLRAALALLKEHNRNGRRKLPDKVPMPFSARHWESLVLQDGTPDRRTYETAVVATLRDRLRAGDAWVEGSRDYRRFDTYLMPADEARSALAETGLETDGQAWLNERREKLHHRLDEVERKLARGQLEDVRIEKGRLKITPYEAVTPTATRRLDTMIDGLMPRIRITDLLWEVNARTGFLDAFTDLRSGRVHSDPVAVLAAILAGAINLGLERMANASGQVSHAQLSWANSWYLRTETYSDALARIIDAHHALPFARVWGSAERTSSDGQFFPSGRSSGQANPKYGVDPGLKIYSFLSGQYGSFDAKVIGATTGEAPFVLDGLVGNAAQFNPLVHYVDTGGVSDHVFALFHLLGLMLVPRLRDFPDRRLACFGKPGRWNTLSPIMGRPINESVVLDHWGSDIMRLAASIKTGSAKPSHMLRKLGAYRQQNRLHLALGEIGRVERSLFMLNWIENPRLRMECEAGLSKSETRHSLAKAVFAHSQGRIHDRSHEAQQKRVMALNLVIAAITYWNTLYMDKAAGHLQRGGLLPDPELLRHLAPLGWLHINLTGDYDWDAGAAMRTDSRPLNLTPMRMSA